MNRGVGLERSGREKELFVAGVVRPAQRVKFLCEIYPHLCSKEQRGAVHHHPSMSQPWHRAANLYARLTHPPANRDQPAIWGNAQTPSVRLTAA